MLAHGEEADLIQVGQNKEIPIVRIIDYGKFLYEQGKKDKKSKTHGGEVKEVRISFKISSHDIETKAKRAKEFLAAGNKVKLTAILRGRENRFEPMIREKMKQFAELVDGTFEQPLVKLGNRINGIILQKK